VKVVANWGGNRADNQYIVESRGRVTEIKMWMIMMPQDKVLDKIKSSATLSLGETVH
jgi:hypothetical protein